jgi:hypothetical protein
MAFLLICSRCVPDNLSFIHEAIDAGTLISTPAKDSPASYCATYANK